MTEIPPRLDETIPIVSEAPHLVAFTLPWQVRPPQDSLTVVVKGTFTLVPDGACTPADEALPPDGDQYVGEPETSGLVYPSDFAVFKPRCDVLLAGHAYPATRDATAARVSLQVGAVARALDAIGDRAWDRGGAMTSPQPFDKIPLAWERAFGGPSYARNPVGRGVRTEAPVWLPNLEDPAHRITTPDDRPAPAGVGPVAPHWPPRASMTGTSYDERWVKTRWPYFSEDFDWSFFQSAPTSQQTHYLRGDEAFELAGVHPTLPTLRGRLPGVRPRVFAQHTVEAGEGFFEVRMNLDTVCFMPDDMTVVVVWRGLFDVRDDDAPEVSTLFVLPAAVGDETPLREAREACFAALARRDAGPDDEPPDEPPEPSDTPELDEVRPRLSIPVRRPAMAADAVAALVASGASLEAVNLTACDLSGLDLSGRDLSKAVLEGAVLTGANLRGANLTEAVLSQCDAEGACFVEATLSLVDLTSSRLAGCDFSRADLSGAVLEQCFAPGVSFVGARGEGAVFTGSMLREARFDRAWMPRSEFTGCVLERATAREAVLDDAQWYDVHAAELDAEGASMKDFRANAGRFPRARLQRVDADGSVWDRADLTEALFDGAALKEATFVRSVLERASLSLVRARESRFRRARMAGCKALRADLMKADLTGADLTGADLRSANLYRCAFWKAKLQATDLTLAHVAGSRLAG